MQLPDESTTTRRKLRVAMMATVLGGACSVAQVACWGRGANAPQVDPERQSEAEYDLAADFLQRGFPRPALDHVRKAVGYNEANAKALYLASVVHLKFCAGARGLEDPDCRLADAQKYAAKALAADEHYRDARNTLGQIFILEGRFKEAIAVLSPLVTDPAYETSFLAWGNLGWAEVLSGNIDSGIKSLKNAVTEPRFCVGHYRLGVAYEKKGDWEQAEASLTNALQVNRPDCQELQDAWAERGEVRAKLGKSGAREDFEKCRSIGADTKTGQTCTSHLAALGSPPVSVMGVR